MDATGAPVPLSFDDAGRIHILDADTLSHAEQLEKESKNFVQRIRDFGQSVHDILEALGAEAGAVESAKRRAIGQRTLAAAEREAAAGKARALRASLDDALAHLARVAGECESLARVEAGQRETIERLSNSEPAGLVV